MEFYKKFLIFYGLYDFSNQPETNLNEIVITVDDNFNVKHDVIKNSSYINNPIIRYSITYIYKLFIIGILLVRPILAIYKSINNRELKYITSNFFALNFLFQFIIGMLYYRKSHFDITLNRYVDYKQYVKISMYANIILSFIIGTISILLMIFNANIPIYQEFYNSSNSLDRIFISLISFLDHFYSYGIFLSNLTTFALTFISISLEITEYATKLEKDLDHNGNDLTIESILIEYADLKTFHTQSVKNNNLLFATITVIGFIYTYFVTIQFNTKYINASNLIEVGTFFIIESVYMYSISRINLAVEEISRVTGNTKFIVKYLTRSKLEAFVADIINNKNTVNNTDSELKLLNFIRDLSIRNVIKNHENSISIDWIILITKIRGLWETFKVMGFVVQDTILLQQLIAITTGLIMVMNLNSIF